MRRLFAVACLLVSLNAAAITLPQTPILPRYDMVESLGIADSYSSMAIDPGSGQPAIVFVDRSGLDPGIVRPAPVRRRWYDGWAWRLETLGTANMLDELGYRNLLYAADAFGRRHVLLLETNGSGFADDALVYLRRDGNGDVREVLGTGAAVSSVFTRLAFTVATDGRPYAAWISNQTASGGTLVVQRREENGTWSAINVSATPGIAGTPNFAATPLQAQFSGVDLIWLELAAATTNVRHARISAALGVTQRNVLSTTSPVSAQYIALEPQGNAEVAVVRNAGPMAFAVERRALGVNSVNWSCPQDQCLFDVQLGGGTGVAERALALGPGGQRAFSYFDATDGPAVSAADPTTGTAWTKTVLSAFASPRDVAYDSAGVLHVAGADNSDHRDISIVRLAGPWTTTAIPSTALGLASVASALSFASDSDNAPLVYGRANPQDLSGALWSTSGFGFASDPLPAGYTVVQSDLAVAEDGAVHLAFRDQQSGHVFHAERGPVAGSGWLVQQVSQGAGVPAFDPRIVLGPRNVPRVLYRQANVLAVAARRVDTGQWLSREVVAGVDGNARASADGTTEAHLIYLSWYDDSVDELRLTSIFGDVADPAVTPGVLTQSVPHPAAWIFGQTAHDLTVTGDGGVGVAYSQTVDGVHSVGYSYFDRFDWIGLGSEPSEFSGEPILTISLDSQFRMGRAPRVAWVQGNTSTTSTLRYAEKIRFGIGWSRSNLGLYPASILDLSTRGLARIAYADAGVLRIARRQETIDLGEFAPVPGARPTSLAWCVCHIFLSFTDCDPLSRISPSRPGAAADADAIRPQEILTGTRMRFMGSAAGRYYLGLFTEHAAEIIRLTLNDANKVEDRLRTMADLLPGLNAFAAGDGSRFRLSPLMIQSARRVWQGWAAAGSPQLAAAVNAELQRTNDLDVFTNMTFEQWFAALSAPGPVDRIHADGFETSP